MNRSKRKSDLKDKIIRGLTVFVLVLLGMLGHAQYRLSLNNETFQCSVPPDLSRGGLVRVNEFYKHEVYAFAREIFQQTYRCEKDCSKEFEQNVNKYSNYYTHSYKPKLLAKAKVDRKRNKGRVRYVSEYGVYDDSKVDKLGNDTFLVHIDFREVEYIGTKKVRDAVVRYPLRVGKVDVDRQKNPWRLQIDGLKGNEARIK
ncbi:DUF2895 family protein [Vibrio rotiferianus]|uniref:DUF2895 family protein n=1 Tax=Vibrio rotiferianus TaxID=190895 RepID=UPI00069357A1|nr:DUF2895 family protein [Vibrio rotiferianus]